MSDSKRLLIMAGGTGGHVFPALSVAKKLRDEGVDVQWMGTRTGLEARVVAENKIPMYVIKVSGLRGKGPIDKIMAPINLATAFFQSYKAIKKANPDCVLGMGGFVAGPGGLATRLLGHPLVIHEQNSVAGLTNKWLAKVADRVLTGFPNTMELPKSATWVGNPVREDMVPRDPGGRKRFRVLIVGGSQGAHTFNMKLPEMFSEMRSSHFKIHHQTGLDQSYKVRELYEMHEIDARVTEFITDMAAEYQWADLLICRAGAMTIAECCAVGKPALLVPYPHSAGGHQVHNANTMVDVGAAEMILDHKVGGPEMVSALKRMTRSREHLTDMSKKAQKLHKMNATDMVAAICKEYMNA